MFWIGAMASARAESLHDFSPPVPVAVSIESSLPDGRDAYPIGETIPVGPTPSPAVPAAGNFLAVAYMEPVQASAQSIRGTVGDAAASFGSDWYAQQPEAVDRASRAAREPRVAEKQRIGDILAQKARRTPAQRKVSSQLLDARRVQVREPTATAEPDHRQTMEAGAMDERVMVDIQADVTPEVLARIRELGGTVVNSVPKYRAIRAQLPLRAVERLAALDAIRTIRPADEARTRAQASASSPAPPDPKSGFPVTRKDDTSEGYVAHRANSARRTHSVDGTGIGIGVISDGVRTLADRQASGDLPARVTVLPGQAGAGDEGTALLEIVHDLAPGAELYFATGFGGQAQMAANIEALCEAGANVIVDDIGYTIEAAFQDDIVAKGVNAAVADGCVFFSAGGNNGNLTYGTTGVWEGDYAAGTSLIVDGETLGVRHDFGDGVEANEVSGSAFRGVSAIVLQWADPLGASANDYDLFLVDEDGDVVAASTDIQDGTQDPIESIESLFDLSGLTVVVVKASGSDRYLRVHAFDGRLAIQTAGNLYGHPAAENAIGVAMVDVGTAAGAGGVFNGTESVHANNSDGPRRIFFQPDGTAITAGDFSETGGKLLLKPDLTAATCVTTATPGFSTFCGTSAAAPHAAAIAALMLEAAGDPNEVTLAQLRTGMTSGSAVLDIGTTGMDRDSGAGIVMAPGAVDAVDVAVADRNGAPTVESAESDRTFAPGAAAVNINLEDVFDDPDDDTLIYEAVSSDPDRLTITRSGSVVTITPVSPGRVVVRLRAIDPDGLSAIDSFSVTVTAGSRDYDADDDGLIDVANLAQLDAMRYDRDGDGLVDGATWMPYYRAFPSGALGMGCPPIYGCIGYELTANLDFDTDGDGDIDSDDTYWNDGKGWAPIGSSDDPFIVRFYGNGHSLTNLFINRPDEDEIGLFGQLGPIPPSGLSGPDVEATDLGFDILDVGLIGVDISGRDGVGSLAGRADGSETRRSHASGRVAGRDRVGGLVGESESGVWQSYAAVKVSGRNSVGGLIGSQSTTKVLNFVSHSRIGVCYATGDVSGANAVGGLVGSSGVSIRAAYATGNVSGTGSRQMGASECELGGGGVGGLVGNACYPRRFGGHIFASYATGMVSGSVGVGGLVGTTHSEVVFRNNYWDMEASGVRVGVGEDDLNENGVIDGTESHSIGLAGRTTAVLQAPTDYEGIYETWNLDITLDGEPDTPWHFGTSRQYPALTADLNENGSATWQEFGYQVRDGLTLTAVATEGQAQVALAWTQVSTSPWSPAPDVTYTLVRDDGTTEEAVEKGATALRYTDTDVTTGATYTYRVTALLDGGEAIRSAPVSVIAGEGNQPPVAVGILEDLLLRVGAGTGTMALSEAFRDPDSDTLTYGASSSETAVATVTSSAAQLTIIPVAAGRAAITVTATDAGGSNNAATQRFTVTVWPANAVDYDTDDDNLIEIGNLAQLDAVRHDLDGDGTPTTDGEISYDTAFANAVERMGCSLSVGCRGYELTADLDFDTDDDGDVDSGDTYWNDGKGWVPIGGAGTTLAAGLYELANPFTAIFEGNGHTVSHLFIGTDTILLVGLFGFTGSSSNIRNLGLIDADVSGPELAAGLVGFNHGRIRGSYVTGRVLGIENVGGLVGINSTIGEIRGSYATSHVSGDDDVGGLVGDNRGEIVASYATGRAAGNTDVGGLVGNHKSTGEISAGYATGTVSGGSNAGGLIGLFEGGSIDASYWDKQTSGHATGVLPFGRTTAQLQSPRSYSDLYGSWNLDINGDSVNDDPWDFGTSSEYPALKADMDGDDDATWTEFGYQLRAGPTLSVSTDSGQPVLTWTAVDASDDWSPEPTVVYTVIRDDGTDLEAIASGLEVLTHTDSTAAEGETYNYQVAAGVGVGEAVRSSIVEVTVAVLDTTPPSVKSIESDATHPTKDPFDVTITFTKSVTGLTGSEIEVTNGTGSNLSGSGLTRTLTVTPDADFDGTVTVTVPAGVAEDSSMNANEAGSATFAVDTLVPALAAANGATVNGATLTLTFDEALAASNTAPSAFTVTGATTRSVTRVSITGTTVRLTLSVPVLRGESGIEVDYDPPSRNPIVDAVGNPAASIADRGVANNTPATTLSTAVRLTTDEARVAEAGPAKTVTVTGTLDRASRPGATAVTVEVGTAGDTATEGTDYAAVDDLTLTIPAYSISGTARFTLTPTNDRIDEPGESLTVTGSTTVAGLSVTPPGGLGLGIEDNDAAPSLALSVSASTIDEDGGTAAVTVSTGSGSTYATDQTVRLAVAGTATETADYTISGKALTLPAGSGTSASMVTATVTGLDDSLDDDDETVEITGSRNGVAFGSRQTIAIDDDDWPELTVTFRQADYRVAEGAHVDLPVTLNAVPERRVTIPIEIEVAGGAEAVDYSVSPASLTFGASETDKTLRVSASNDSAVDPGEGVTLSFGTTLPERISEGGIAETTVAIRDTDFTFAAAFAAGAGTAESDAGTYTVSEASSALRLSLTLKTPRGARLVDIVDPVVVTLATRENAGGREADEDYATQRRSGTFGDYGALDRDLSFAPADFSDDASCGCARAEKSVAVDLFDDRVRERVEVFGLRLSRQSGRLGVSSQDVTAKIAEDDAEPALTLDASPARIAEAGGVSTVTVSTGSGSTFAAAQTLRLELTGTATRGSDYTIDATALTLPPGTGRDPSSVTTAVRALDDPFDDNAETVVLAASRDGLEFARRTVTIADDDPGSTRVDLAVNPAEVREDAGATTVRVTAALDGAAREEDTAVSVTVGAPGDSAVEGTDYATVADLALTIDAGETAAETTFRLNPTDDDAVEGAKTITVAGRAAGLAVRATNLTLNDDDVESTTVTLTLDPREVGESVRSRTVRVTGTLDGGARPTPTVVAVTVGSGSDTATEGEDYAEVPALELTIPPNRTSGTTTFTLTPTNDATAEGTETISVSGNVAGLAVAPAELALADDDAPSTRLDLSLEPSAISEAAAPTEVVVTGSLDAGARTTDSTVTVTVGASADSATEGSDYAYVSVLQLTVPANETTGRTMFTLRPDNDAVAEGAETISITGRVSGLTVEPTNLTLSDNDTASRVVTLSVDPESVSEDTPADVTVTASLNAGARAEDTQVRLTVGAAGDTAVPGTDYERVSERTLTIPAGETSGTAVFRLEPFDNDSTDGARTLSVTGSTTVAELHIEPATGARIALADDDSPAVLLMPQALTVVEAGSASYEVTLQTRPTADVTVTITGAAGDLSLDKTSLVFTGADWRVPQVVTVTAADDEDSVQDPDVTLTHRASGADEYRGLRADLVVTIRENDPALVFSRTSVTVPEGGMTEYTVALAIEPSGNVMVSISGVSGDLSLNRTDLQFSRSNSRSNWNIAQTVTVEAAEDDDASTDPAVTLTHRASDGGYDGIVGEVRVTVTENDGGGTGGGSGGGAANRPPVVEREIDDQTLDVGEVLELDIRLNFYDRDQRALDYTAESADRSVATVAVDRNGVLTIRGIARGVTAITVTAADRRDERVSQAFTVTVRGPFLVGLFPRASDPVREGFVRVINRSLEAGEVTIEATDDAGTRLGPVTLSVAAGATAHFNSDDLEQGNASKGLPSGVGSAEGDWRLELMSALDIEVLSYIRTVDGFLTSMHDSAPVAGGVHRVVIFNPGSNPNQVSRLRLLNLGSEEALVRITGIDDAGASPGESALLAVPAGASRTVTAVALEMGTGAVEDALGDGAGKWRLRVDSDQPIRVMSLLSSPTGHLTNLSTAPDRGGP